MSTPVICLQREMCYNDATGLHACQLQLVVVKVKKDSRCDGSDMCSGLSDMNSLLVAMWTSVIILAHFSAFIPQFSSNAIPWSYQKTRRPLLLSTHTNSTPSFFLLCGFRKVWILVIRHPCYIKCKDIYFKHQLNRNKTVLPTDLHCSLCKYTRTWYENPYHGRCITSMSTWYVPIHGTNSWYHGPSHDWMN